MSTMQLLIDKNSFYKDSLLFGHQQLSFQTAYGAF